MVTNDTRPSIKDQIIQVIDEIKSRGYEIIISEEINVNFTNKLCYIGLTRLQELKRNVNNITFYKNLSLEENFNNLYSKIRYLIEIEALEKSGGYPQEIQDICEHILKQKPPII